MTIQEEQEKRLKFRKKEMTKEFKDTFKRGFNKTLYPHLTAKEIEETIDENVEVFKTGIDLLLEQQILVTNIKNEI